MALLAAPVAGAESIIEVTTLADPGAGECEATGQCSLREALEQIGSGKVSGEVRVEIEPKGKIELDGNELEVTAGGGVASIVIAGPGAAQLSVDAAGNSRVFRVGDVSLKISGLTIEGGKVDSAAINGSGGAGLYSEVGAVTLEDVRVTDNEVESFRDGGGIAIEEEGELEVVDSRIDHNSSEHYGGGVFIDNFAPVTIRESEIDNNEAGRGGGGIDARGEGVTVRESSLSWNTAGEAGGGLYAQAPGQLERSTVNGNAAAESDGGGGLAMDAENETFTVATSTIAGNSGGGIREGSGEVAVESSTVVANTTATRAGAGIEGDDLRIRNSILAANTKAGSEADCAGKVASEGANIVGGAAAAPGCEWQAGPGDTFETDPQLGPLALNGGPTYTMAPASRESPAINHGVTTPPLDQRGLARPVPASLYDVGAVEVQAPHNLAGHEPAISAPSEAVVGDTISCEAGQWDTDTVTDPSFAFTWMVGAEVIASGATHQLANADAGRKIECAVSADNGVTAVTARSQPFELEPAAAELSPAPLDLGSRRVGAGPGNGAALTVTNGGGADLEIDAVLSHNSQFPLEGSACLAAPLAPGDSCQVQVSFAPTTAGPLSTEVVVESNAPDASAEVTGTGIQPMFAVTPRSFDFGGRPLGTGPSAATRFAIANVGTASMAIGTVALGGPNASQFQLGADHCSGATLKPGEECTLNVIFTPTETGMLSATIGVPGQAPSTIAISGTGTKPALSVSPGEANFGSRLLGTAPSAPRTFTVTSTGTATVQIGTAVLAGPGAASFALQPGTNTCSGAKLGPGQHCSLAVTFSPRAAGSQTATLQLPGGTPVAVALSGSGTEPPASSPSTPSQSPQAQSPPPGGSAAAPELTLAPRQDAYRVDDDGRIPVALRCQSSAACQATLELWRGSHVVGRWQGAIRAGAFRQIALRLNRRGRSELGRRPLQGTLVLRTAGGPAVRATVRYGPVRS